MAFEMFKNVCFFGPNLLSKKSKFLALPVLTCFANKR